MASLNVQCQKLEPDTRLQWVEVERLELANEEKSYK